MVFTWCGESHQGGGELISCAMYTFAYWIPAGAFCAIYPSRSKITMSFLHFSSLDSKNQQLVLAFNLLCAACVMLPLFLFMSSDQTSLVLLTCSVLQCLAWALCAILGTLECWRIQHWPSAQVNAYIYSACLVALLQVLTLRRSGEVQSYSQSMAAIGTVQVVGSGLLVALVSLKDFLFTPAEKERLEMDRVCVVSAASAVLLSDPRSDTFLSPLFRRFLGGGCAQEGLLNRSTSGVSLKSWFGSGGAADDDKGYAVIGHDEEEWSPGRSLSNDSYGKGSHETQSVVLSALERNQGGTGSSYAPPAEDEWSVLSGSGEESLQNDSSTSIAATLPFAAAQSPAVRRATQSQNARIAAAGAASFGTSLPSVRSSSRSAASNTASTPHSPWSKESTKAKDTDFYTLAASKWGVRRRFLGDDGDNAAAADDDDDDDGEIEFEITVKVQKAGSVDQDSTNSSWHAASSSVGAAGSTADPKNNRTKWSVWRTGTELMSLHSQLVISHGETAVPRRLKLKSMQPKRGNNGSSSSTSNNNSTSSSTTTGNRLARTKSTDRTATPLHLLDAPNSPTKDTVTSQHDIAGDMRAISVYLMALLSMSNKSVNLSASGGGGSIGIPVGCLQNLYPSLLSFLELYVGGSSSVDATSASSPSASGAAGTQAGQREGNKSRSNSLIDNNHQSSIPPNHSGAEVGDESCSDSDKKTEKWRKLFTKLKATLVLRDQCVRCRMFPSCIRGSDVYNFLQMANDNFLKEEEALEIGSSLVECELLRPISAGYSEMQFANTSAYLCAFADASKTSTDSTRTGSNKVEVLGGFGLDCEITDTDNGSADGTVRYCLRLKHIGSQGVKVDNKVNSSCSDRWVCWKRYSEFDNLHNTLCTCGFPPPAPLPPKALFAGLSALDPRASAAVDPRRDGLQTYLRSAIDCVMNGGDDDRDSNLGEAPRASESMFDVILMLDNVNNLNKGVGWSDAKEALAHFLDPEHEKLIIV